MHQTDINILKCCASGGRPGPPSNPTKLRARAYVLDGNSPVPHEKIKKKLVPKCTKLISIF